MENQNGLIEFMNEVENKRRKRTWNLESNGAFFRMKRAKDWICASTRLNS